MATIFPKAPLFVVLCAFSLTLAASDPLPVTVEFVNPESFTDIKDRRFASPTHRNPNLHGLRQHLQRRASMLGPGQTLQVRFTDIDLAGDIEPGTDLLMNEVRRVTGQYPPRLKFQYLLRDSQGQTLKSGDADLRDLGFQVSPSGSSSDPLRHEKRLLDQWLRELLGG